MTFLKGNSFLSGIPFYSDSAVDFSKSILKNFLKTNNQSFYLPFNTLSNGCFFQGGYGADAPTMLKCSLDNKNGSSMISIIFANIEGGSNEEMIIMNIANLLNLGQSTRKSFIITKFQEVNNAVYQAEYKKRLLASVQMKDADVKKAKEARIAEMKLQLAALVIQLSALNAKKITLSKDLQSIQTKASEVGVTKLEKTAKKQALLDNIKTLQKTKITKDVIKEYETKNTKNMELLKYWLDGSVYHRIISETEVAGMVAEASKESFNDKLKGYFFPQ